MGDAVDIWGAVGNLAVAVWSGGEVVDESCAGLLCVVDCHGVLRRMSLALDKRTLSLCLGSPLSLLLYFELWLRVRWGLTRREQWVLRRG